MQNLLPRIGSVVVALAATLLTTLSTAAQSLEEGTPSTIEEWMSPEGISRFAPTLIFIAAISVVPALILMTTSFVRIAIVLNFVRQAIGLQGMPSTQAVTALSLFMTVAIMTPTWNQIYENAYQPYRNSEISWDQALDQARIPLTTFMARQIERTGNSADVRLFLRHTHDDPSSVASYADVPFRALAPAFLLSELKTAFLIGFQLLLPFLIIDIVVSSIITSSGLIGTSPTVITLPLKLALFVLVDGWNLLVGVLLDSFV